MSTQTFKPMVGRCIVNKLNEVEHVKGQALGIFCWIQFQVSFLRRIMKIIKFKIETHFRINKTHHSTVNSKKKKKQF